MSDCHLSIIIPAYNEVERLPRTLKETLQFLQRQSYSSELIVVTDGSSDGTIDLVRTWSQEHKNMKLVSFAQNRGKGFAVREGMLQANGKYRLFMDADYAVPVDFVQPFLEAATTGSAVVVGSRALATSQILQSQPAIRGFLARCFGKVQRLVLRLPIADTQCGFKLFTADAAKTLFSLAQLDCSYFDAEVLFLAHRLDLSIKELPVVWTHDQETRLPIGPRRTLDILIKLFSIKRMHGHLRPAPAVPRVKIHSGSANS